MMSYNVIHAPHRGGDEGLTRPRPWQGVRVCEGQPHGRGGPGQVPACEVITFNGFTLPVSHDPGHEELIKLVHHPIMRGRGREEGDKRRIPTREWQSQT